MKGLKPLSPDASPELDDTFQHFRDLLGYVPNNVLILSRKPKMVKGLAQLASAVWDPANEVDRGLKRLVAYMASRTHRSKYSMAHSAEAAYRSGIPDEKVEAVDEYRTSPLYTEAERAALDFTVAAASQPNVVTEELFDRMRKYWTENQIVEIAAVVAINGFLNRWNDTMSPPLEEEPAEFARKHLPRHFAK
jgi:alkylhydroperoxidase family enzyme